MNNGRCVERRHKEGVFEACDCGPSGGNYEGPHCEYVRGSTPFGWGTAEYGRRSSATKSGMTPGATAVVVLAMLAIAAGAGLIVIRKHRNNEEREETNVNGEGENGAAASTTTGDDASSSKKSYSTRSIGLPTDLQLDADGGVLQEAMANEEQSKGAGDDDDDVVDVEII